MLATPARMVIHDYIIITLTACSPQNRHHRLVDADKMQPAESSASFGCGCGLFTEALPNMVHGSTLIHRTDICFTCHQCACRIVTQELSELRAVNVRAIRAARASAAAAGLADGRGYDLLVVPQVGWMWIGWR